jgi:zinc transport system substrate-binding protein
MLIFPEYMTVNSLILSGKLPKSLFILFLLFLPFTGCRHVAVNPGKEVTVSILPQKYIVERIAGNLFTINVMMPPGANHETYEPSPLSMKSLANSKVYFSVGWLDFEKTWTPRFTDLFPEMKIVNTSEGGELLTYEGNGHNEHGTGIDPHTWLSLRYVKFQAVKIAASLSQTDPDHAVLFNANLRKFARQLDSIDTIYSGLFAPMKNVKFLIYHPALGYFARDYKLKQISLETEGKEPSAAHLSALIEIARKEGIHSVLVSKEFDSRNAETLAREINGRVVVFDPMAADLLGNLDRIAKILSNRQN